jgi:hypothetical protein
MWPFRKKRQSRIQRPAVPCPRCGGSNTRLMLYHGGDRPDYVRTWRGRRALTYRCFDCGLDFYGEEPCKQTIEEAMADDRAIDDEEALHAAEEELRRQVKEERDRRCR